MSLEEESEERPQRKKGQQPGRKSSGRTRHTDLPTSVEVHEPLLQACPSCQAPFASYGSPEEAEILEVTVRAHRRIVCRPRFRKTCSCVDTPKTTIAPPAPRLVPKGKLGISVWTTVLIDKFAYNRPTARLIKDLKDRGLSLAHGTITSGLKSFSDLFAPLYDKIVERSRTASFSQADETRYYVYGDTEGKTNGSKKHPHRWWLWVLLTLETVVYILVDALLSFGIERILAKWEVVKDLPGRPTDPYHGRTPHGQHRTGNEGGTDAVSRGSGFRPPTSTLR